MGLMDASYVLQRAEMRMVRWICDVKLKDRVPSKGLRERFGLDDIILVLQQNRLQWYGYVMRKDCLQRNKNKKLQSNLEKAVSPPLMAEKG